MIMLKKILLVSAVVAFASAAKVCAESRGGESRKASDFLYCEVNSFATATNAFSADWRQKGYPENMLLGWDLKFGARIRKDWGVFLMTEIPVVISDRYASPTVFSKANLGVGATRIISPDNWMVFLQPSVSVISTGFRADNSYLKPNVEFRVGLDARFRPYIGLRAEYMYHYNNPDRSMFLYGFCLGIILL